jgi:hypothetical protein
VKDVDLFGAGTGVTQKYAEISDCGRYRYRLKRWWHDREEAPWVLWIMLNPSTADASTDDPTIRRCMAFARAWGMGGISVVNLFGWRATDPTDLAGVKDPVGPDNQWAIDGEARRIRQTGGLIVAAWGAHKMAAARGRVVINQISDLGINVMCLKTTAKGQPWHPLYVPGCQKPVLYAGSSKGGAK